MAAIFISYRRGPNAERAHALHADLGKQFGPNEVFIDQVDIRSGYDFVEDLARAIDACRVVVAVIGEDWVPEVPRAEGEDHVWYEIGRALANQVPIVPVLLEDAPLPEARRLPAAVRECRRGCSESFFWWYWWW